MAGNMMSSVGTSVEGTGEVKPSGAEGLTRRQRIVELYRQMSRRPGAQAHIAQMLGVSPQYVSIVIRDEVDGDGSGKRIDHLTAEYGSTIKTALASHQPIAEITQGLGISEYYVRAIIRKLISSGEITDKYVVQHAAMRRVVHAARGQMDITGLTIKTKMRSLRAHMALLVEGGTIYGVAEKIERPRLAVWEQFAGQTLIADDDDIESLARVLHVLPAWIRDGVWPRRWHRPVHESMRKAYDACRTHLVHEYLIHGQAAQRIRERISERLTANRALRYAQRKEGDAVSSADGRLDKLRARLEAAERGLERDAAVHQMHWRACLRQAADVFRAQVATVVSLLGRSRDPEAVAKSKRLSELLREQRQYEDSPEHQVVAARLWSILGNEIREARRMVSNSG